MSYRGTILKIDLTTERISQEPIPSELTRKYVGGEGINSWLLWQHFLKVNPKIDPTSKDNVLIAGMGPLGATGYGAGSKMRWTFKSPATGIFGDAACGGTFAAQLRWAGYDHVVITGRAKKPVYLWINNDSVEFKDAQHLWGKCVSETDDRIKEELGDSEVEMACVGRAAENLVPFSGIMVSRYRAAARTGGGCVMASKNLKAIAARGSKGIAIYDPEAFLKASDAFMATIKNSPEGPGVGRRKKYGTTLLVERYQKISINAYRNNQFCQLPQEKSDKLNHLWYEDNFLHGGTLACSPGCIDSCFMLHKIKGDESPAAKEYAGEIGHRPEILELATFGIMCDIPDMAAVCHLSNLCSEHSMDLCEVGNTCSLLMELYQRGIISDGDLTEWFGEPLHLEWGNYQAVEKVINSIALQSNKLGGILKDGVYKAAQRIEELKNVPVLKYAIYGKGGQAFSEEIRNLPSAALIQAVASRGACHMKAPQTLDKFSKPEVSEYYFGTPDGAKPLDTTLKGAGTAVFEIRKAMTDSLGICYVVAGTNPLISPPQMFADAVSAATGIEMSGEELWAVGERTVNLEKAFNSRLGLRREDDRLCERWVKEEMAQGYYGAGWKAENYLDEVKDEYYQYHGWDKETSLQTRTKLEELGMEDIGRVLEKEKALV